MRNMTQGRILGHLLSVAIPLILGNFFQLTYNAVDSIIVGKFAGEGALAAVSAANPVMTIVILGVSGFAALTAASARSPAYLPITMESTALYVS